MKAVQCSALTKHLLIFDANGDIYTCWEAVGDTKYKISSVFDENVNHEKQRLKTTEKEKCFNCKLYPICHAGCPKQYKDPLEDNCMFNPEVLIKDICELIVNE